MCTDGRDVVLNVDRLGAGLDTGSRSNAFRGEAQQGRLTQRFREWSGDSMRWSRGAGGEVSGYSCSSGCTVGIFYSVGEKEIRSHLYKVDCM